MDFSDLLESAKSAAEKLGKSWDIRLNVILRYCWDSPQKGAFPQIGRLVIDDTEGLSAYRKIGKDKQKVDVTDYLMQYLIRYFNARESQLALKEVQTIADPAVDVILEAFTQLEDLPAVSENHRISMAAENLLGELLERYIANRLEPHGWVWCAGNVVRSVDFLSQDLSIALQIKNRDNSENSSSSAIRDGTNIQKWFRIYSRTGRTNWENFPLEWENFPLKSGLSEDDFHRYIKDYAKGLK
ncbi:SinI family restriction endonuclease [Meiothermus sp. CFH 77666]|uniref:SinI family restriction endonuclease n=1 Tax=Meiothermus sp. CFH 77666 TaxID=2817942 RepID=UPI001AA04576|nr:SinI family restriction endonuclease [Meiothermus sp. CFH 77666]MBO1436941.1 SinI family restriction endonuclease [Meiothermus sp. CFH 77666]